MILDTIDNLHLYKGMSPRIAKALQLLTNEDFKTKESGRYNIEGDNIYYMVQRYETLPVAEGKFEAHRKYIDIQFVADGQELLGYAQVKDLQTDTPYDDTGDAALYALPKDFTPVHLKSGVFAVLFPDDAHMPCRQVNGPAEVLKVVVKVRKDIE